MDPLAMTQPPDVSLLGAGQSARRAASRL